LKQCIEFSEEIKIRHQLSYFHMLLPHADGSDARDGSPTYRSAPTPQYRGKWLGAVDPSPDFSQTSNQW
jgi:hypothetical protein